MSQRKVGTHATHCCNKSVRVYWAINSLNKFVFVRYVAATNLCHIDNILTYINSSVQMKKSVPATCWSDRLQQFAGLLVQYYVLLYNFVKKCPNNSQNEYKYTAIFGQLVICILPV